MPDDPQGFRPPKPEHKKKPKSKNTTVSIQVAINPDDMFTVSYEKAAHMKMVRIDED